MADNAAVDHRETEDPTCTRIAGGWICPPEYGPGHVHNYRPAPRATRLAALDHLRSWCENEDAPAPTYVQSHSTITRADEIDQATRFAMVDAFAARHEVKVVDAKSHYFASVSVYDGTAGVTITYALFAERDHETAL